MSSPDSGSFISHSLRVRTWWYSSKSNFSSGYSLFQIFLYWLCWPGLSSWGEFCCLAGVRIAHQKTAYQEFWRWKEWALECPRLIVQKTSMSMQRLLPPCRHWTWVSRSPLTLRCALAFVFSWGGCTTSLCHLFDIYTRSTRGTEILSLKIKYILRDS